MAAEGLAVQVCYRVLEVSQSGFYAWRSPPPSRRGRSATPGSPIRSAGSTPPPGRPGMGVHLVGVQPARQGVRAGALHGRRRRLLRQCHDLVVLVPHADRAAGPAPLAPASSWPTRSLSTWSCSTTASAATAHLACSARSSSRPAIPPPWHDKSSLSAHKTRRRPEPPGIPARSQVPLQQRSVLPRPYLERAVTALSAALLA
jgi:hypothetical protein